MKVHREFTPGGDAAGRQSAGQAQARLAAIVETSDDAIISKDLDSIIRSWNAGAQRLFGYTADEAIGQPVTMLMPPDRVDEEPGILRRISRGESINHYETVRRRKDGTLVNISLTVSPITDERGRIVGASKIARDITERKHTEEALRASEAKYRTLFESIDEGFCIVEVIFDEGGKPVDYRFLEVNPAFERQTGMTAVAGRTIRELAPQQEQHWFETYGRIALTGEAARFELPAAELNRWYDVYAWRYGEPDRRQVAVLFKDVTPRKQAEAALRENERQLELELAAARLLQETSTRLIREDDVEALYGQILDTAVSIMQSDFASMQMLHPDRGQLELLGARGFSEEAKAYWKWVGTQSGSSCALALQDGKRCMVTDSRTDEYLARSGTRDIYLQAGILSMQSTPLLSRSGELIGMITTHWKKAHWPSERDLRLFDVLARQAADVIERNKAQAQLRESAAALHEADRRKDEFLAVLSHELRNPLAPIRNAVSLLHEADDEPPVRAQARAILERQVGHMIRLVDDLLDIARISRGSISLRKEVVRLDDIVASAIETSRPLIEDGGHSLEINVPEGPIWLSGDRVRLTQVIANLLNNAARYTRHGGSIALTARAHAGNAEITVRDNGIGIEQQHLPGIFNMFSQGGGSQLASGGLGIGLALARQLVELHGGSIEARSEGADRGSEFIVRVPLPITSELAREAAQPRAPAGGRRVLIADDNVDAAQSLGMLLSKMGHAVQLSYDGVAALEIALREPPEIVLLDIDMPNLDGFAVATRLRADQRFDRVPIVALTGLGQDVDRKRARLAGFDQHVLKPVDTASLREALELIRSKGESATAVSDG